MKKHYRRIDRNTVPQFRVACGADVHWTYDTTPNMEEITCLRCHLIAKEEEARRRSAANSHMKRIPEGLSRAVAQGLTLRDYAVLVALVANKTPMTRQQLEEATGLEESAVCRATARLCEFDIIAPDKKPVVGGAKDRAAKFSIK
jgi:hypothetical protein